MTNNAQVAIGGPMSPEQEADHRQRLAAEAADQADAEVDVIEAKLAGMKAALADKKAEAKRLRQEAKEAKEAHG